MTSWEFDDVDEALTSLAHLPTEAEADAVYQLLQEPYDRLEQIASTVERVAAWQAAGAWPRVTLADVGVLAKLRANVRAQLQQIESRLAEIDDSVFGLIALRDEPGRPSS